MTRDFHFILLIGRPATLPLSVFFASFNIHSLFHSFHYRSNSSHDKDNFYNWNVPPNFSNRFVFTTVVRFLQFVANYSFYINSFSAVYSWSLWITNLILHLLSPDNTIPNKLLTVTPRYRLRERVVEGELWGAEPRIDRRSVADPLAGSKP